MSPTTVEEAVATYTLKRPLYEGFSAELQHLLRSILDANAIRVQIVESRAKTIESFREKISRPGKSYSNPLEEIPDLCGCRIITYYGDEVSKISKLIKNEFGIVEEELSHQPDQLEADRFGYLSMHYVVRINTVRSDLSEWAPYKDLHAEIQIRTVIQHAWSAVSHALQYKQETSIPSILRRRLYRIAGLFELADEEFVGIREQRAALERSAAEALSQGNRDIPLTSSSIEQFVKTAPEVLALTEAAATAGFTILPEVDPHDSYTAEIYEVARANDIKSVADLAAAITKPSNVFLREAIGRNEGPWEAGPDFLVYLLLISKSKQKIQVEDLVSRGWGESVARAVVEAVEQMSSRKSSPSRRRTTPK